MELSKVYIFRMTHIENIPHILENGITHRNSNNRNLNYKPIGDNSLISTRNSFALPNKGGTLGDYIPFYFGERSPMLYVIQKGFNGVPSTKPQEIVYCVSSIQKMLDLGMMFLYTDGHATDGLTSFYTSKEISNIESHIDFNAVKAKYWSSDVDLDLKRRKEAECLIKNDIPPDGVLGFVVYNQGAKGILLQYGVKKKVVIRDKYYF